MLDTKVGMPALCIEQIIYTSKRHRVVKMICVLIVLHTAASHHYKKGRVIVKTVRKILVSVMVRIKEDKVLSLVRHGLEGIDLCYL